MALYHVYRPQKFSEIVGQEHIVQTLSNQIKKNTLAHAYIFSGPRGTGKTTTARIVAKSINCKNRKPEECEPCNECSACKEITSGSAIDVIEIDAASNTGVDHVREHIIENAQFRPTFFGWKIFIIDEVHMLSTSAFNALLKTLEEPPTHTIFILATTDLEKIPETIISRCQRFSFHRMEQTATKEYLKKIAVQENRSFDDEVLDQIIQKSEGGMRDAVSLLDQLLGIDEKHITLENASLLLPQVRSEDIQKILRSLESADLGGVLSLLHDLRAKGTHFLQFTDELIGVLRDALVAKIQKQPEALSFSLEETFRLIEILLRRRLELRTTPLPTLPLEMAFIEWMDPSVRDVAPTTKKLPVKESVQVPPQPSIQVKVQEIAVAPEKEEVPVEILDTVEPEQETQIQIEAIEQKTIQNEIAETFQNVSIEFSTLQKKWSDIIAKIEKESPSLVLVLKTATLTKLEGDTLYLCVPYKFHQGKLTDKVNMRKIEAAFQDIFGEKIHYEVVVSEKPAENNEADELAALMGGQVI